MRGPVVGGSKSGRGRHNYTGGARQRQGKRKPAGNRRPSKVVLNEHRDLVGESLIEYVPANMKIFYRSASRSRTMKGHKELLTFVVGHAEEIINKKIQYACVELDLEYYELVGNADFVYADYKGNLGVIEAESKYPSVKVRRHKEKLYGCKKGPFDVPLTILTYGGCFEFDDTYMLNVVGTKSVGRFRPRKAPVQYVPKCN